VGFLGAFTTFSTFSLESVAMLQQERWLAFASYVGFSLTGCLLATVAGMWLSKSLV
jgi:CrcB protein